MTPSAEHLVRVGDVELCWQEFGDHGDPPILMIMGIGAQMILWPEGLCELLAERGLRVVRFDNRDAGRSTILAAAGRPSLTRILAGHETEAPYALSDMAGDAAGLLDALEIDRAHVFGSSMGGMIAQTLAIERPERVLSLASIMSTTGDREVGQPSEIGLGALMSAPPADRDGYVEATVWARATIGSPGFPRDERYSRDLAGRVFDRGYHPDGTLRQLVAILASGDRTPRLRELEVPTVVIHGEDDELIDVSGGRATAAAIPGARLLLIPGLGHDLPAGAWEAIADAVVANTERAITSVEV